MAKKIERRLDRNGIDLHLQELVSRLEVLVDLARRVHVTVVEGPDHAPDLRSDDVRVYTNTADPSELEERKDQNVVSRVEREVRLTDDAPGLDEVGIRLLDRSDGRDLGQFDDRLRLDVDDDATGNVVDDDRPVADVGDRTEVFDDSARGGFAVVRRDDEEGVYTELVRFTRQVDGVSRGVGAGPGDDGSPPAKGVDGDTEELEPFVVRERRALPVVPATTIPSDPFSTRCSASSLKRSKSIVPSGLKGVTIAVRASPSTPLVYSAWV